MLTNEIEIIEGYFDFVCIRPSIRDAWNHIKKELEELSKTPTNRQSNAICVKGKNYHCGSMLDGDKCFLPGECRHKQHT